MSCAGCRQIRRTLVGHVRTGDYAAAVKTAKQGARQIIAKVISRPPPPVIRKPPRR